MFNCPLSINKADNLIEHLVLKDGYRVLDVGCGEGEFLIRVAERYQFTGVGLDCSPDCIAIANEKARVRVPHGDISFICQDARSLDWKDSKVDIIFCIGSEFILGGYRSMLQHCSEVLTDVGKLLVGTIFWEKEPAAEYLELMNGENPHFNYLTTVDIAVEERFMPLYLCRSNADEWDDFESRHAQKRYLTTMQTGDQVALKRIYNWQRGYLKWGRETMGFGFLLLQKHSKNLLM